MHAFKFLVLLSLILVVFSTAAAEFDVKVDPITDTISTSDIAKFRVYITNQDKLSSFRVYYNDVLWDVYTEPRGQNTIAVSKDETGSVTLALRPLSRNINEGHVYVIPLNVVSISTGEIKTVGVNIGVRSEEEIQELYAPVIRGDLALSQEIDPRNDFTIKVDLRNLNPRNFSSVKVKLASQLINQELSTALAPWEKKSVEFQVKLDRLQAPLKDRLTSYVSFPLVSGKIFEVELDHQQYEVVAYGSIEPVSSIAKKFLKTTQTITFTNDANAANERLHKEQASWFRLFTSTEPEAQIIKENGKTYYGWDIALEPQETFAVHIITNYRILFYLAVLAIICVALYYLLRSPLVVLKSTSNVLMREGGISEIKVLLNVMNRGFKPVDDIRVVDQVPHIAELKKEFDVGTLQPTGILKHEMKGTILRWKIESLEPFEERILSYTIKSKLSILGEFRLPVASAYFLYSQNKRKTRSNKAVTKC